MSSRSAILLHYIKRYKTGYIIGFITLFLTDIFMLIKPRLVGQAIDSLDKQNPVHPLVYYVLIFIVIVCIENVFRVIWRKSLMGSSRRLERDFLNDFFGHLLKLDPAFFDRTPTGDLMARATNDVASIRMMIGPGFMALFDAVVVFSLTLFFMISVSPSLTLYAMLPMPVLALLLAFVLRYVHNSYDKVQEQFSNMSNRAQENLSGIRVIKAHNREKFEIGEFNSVTTDYVKKYMHLTKYESSIDPMIRFFAGLGVVIVFFVGGFSVMRNDLTLGQLVQFFLYLMLMVWPVIAIGWGANLYERGMASLGRIKRIFDEQPTIASHKAMEPLAYSEQPCKLRRLTGDIEFRNVSFNYCSINLPSLKNINLKIKEGSTLGIVGPMGCGKTTLINLIPRLYDPTQGSIMIGGKDIREIPAEELRQNISFVPQEPFLFSRTIKENLNLGRKVAPLNEEEFINALKMADLLGDVRGFPSGMETIVGERGLTLSGGQKQRMTIARALARKACILILDDTLSSVDSHTEQRIIKNLHEYGKGRTNLIVSHRISSVKDADLIIVLQDGEIIEQGVHEQLLEYKGFYAKLYYQQLLQQQIEEM